MASLERLPRRDPCRAIRRLDPGASTKFGFRRQHHACGDIEGAQRVAITAPAGSARGTRAPEDLPRRRAMRAR